MTVIDLSAKKYQKDKVVVKCGKKEFVAVANDKTMNRIFKANKNQITDGLMLAKKIDSIDLDDVDEKDISKEVNSLVNLFTGSILNSKKDNIELADAIFGNGAGKEIYEYLRSSTIALNSVLEDVMNELYKKEKQTETKAKKKYRNKAKKVK